MSIIKYFTLMQRHFLFLGLNAVHALYCWCLIGQLTVRVLSDGPAPSHHWRKASHKQRQCYRRLLASSKKIAT